jgi:hypothetical protein
MGREKIVNVILNSNNKTSGTTQKAFYTVDWGAILKNNTKYDLHFTYIGGVNTITGTRIATVYADFQTSNIQNSATSFGAQTSQMLGFIMPTVLQGSTNTSYLQALDTTNVHTCLENRPMNNNFCISIFDNASPPALFLDNATTPVNPAPYILMLSFREMTEDD